MSDLRVDRMFDGGYSIIDSEQTKELTKVVVITQNATYECKKPDQFQTERKERHLYCLHGIHSTLTCNQCGFEPATPQCSVCHTWHDPDKAHAWTEPAKPSAVEEKIKEIVHEFKWSGTPVFRKYDALNELVDLVRKEGKC
jgi:hypothetical protein